MLFDVITAFAQDSGWPFEVVEPGSMLHLALKGEHGPWTTVIMADAEFDQCVVFSYLTEEVRPARRAAVAEFLTRANYGLRVGNFEMDFDDGEVRFRTSVDLAGETLAPALLKQLVSHNALQFDRYLPGLEAVLQGAAPASAVRMVEDAPA